LLVFRDQVTASNDSDGSGQTPSLADLQQTQAICRDLLQIVAESTKGQQHWQRKVLDALKQTHGQTTQSGGSATLVPSVGIHDLLSTAEAQHIGNRLLHDLQFQEMDYRYERIPIAHEKTFQWIFQAPPQNARWANFLGWIQNDDPIYWITGKAGSGKSTLTRFLRDHEKTQNAFQAWAADRPLALGAFFFWNSGAEIQMSYEGLLRTLLHQFLKQMPKLIPIVLPYRAEACMLFDDRSSPPMSWTWEELIKAFRILVDRATQTTKLAIFIDGLDEFSGNPAELVQLITTLSNRNVKICVSSRPWIVFEDSYGDGPHLRLEDLTYNDIKSYVTSKLTATMAFQTFQEMDSEFSARLIDTLCSKSSGVFLWVTLVTHSLLEGVSEGERLCDLQKRLDSLPADLEKLFSKILGSLSSTHFERASQYFQINRASIVQLSLLEFSFADEDDPDYGFSVPCKALSQQEILARRELMRRRINASCKGLLDAKMQDSFLNSEVTYMHRTVKDFLEKPEIWNLLCRATDSSFNPNLRLVNSMIALLKSVEPVELYELKLSQTVSATIEYTLRGNRDGSECQIRAIAELDRTMTHLFTIPRSNKSTLFAFSIPDMLEKQSVYQGNYQFIGVALKCELVVLIQTLLAAKKKHEASLHASKILHLTILNNNRSSANIYPALTSLPPSARVVKLLFEFGADPHWKDDDWTTWEVLHAQILENPGFIDQSIIDTFRKHSADSKSITVPVKSASPKVERTLRPDKLKAKWSRFVSRRLKSK
jgi:hypothetical protein